MKTAKLDFASSPIHIEPSIHKFLKFAIPYNIATKYEGKKMFGVNNMREYLNEGGNNDDENDRHCCFPFGNVN